MVASPRFPKSARLGESWQLVPTESRITPEPKVKALRVVLLGAAAICSIRLSQEGGEVEFTANLIQFASEALGRTLD